MNKSSSSSSSSSSCNTSLNEFEASNSPNKPKKSSQVSFVEELINSSEDEKVYDRSYNPTESLVNQDLDKTVDSMHSCSYFEVENEIETLKCTHTKSIFQNICLDCDHEIKLKDSLDHMAFTSPVKSIQTDNKWKELLKFDSPTINEQEIENNLETESKSHDSTITILEDDEFDDENASMTIINDTINESLNETIPNTNENIKPDSQTCEDIDFEENGNHSYISSRRLSSQYSQSMSMSETSIFWSDSDDSERDEHFLLQENKNELKRKKALEVTTYKDELDVFLYEKKNMSRKSFSPLSLNSIKKQLTADEGWFCPCIAPPLVTEINENYLVNNEPIVQFYKTNKKFKMVCF